MLLGHLAALERRTPGQIDVPQAALDVRSFFTRSTVEKKIGTIQRYEVDYVMVRANSPPSRMLKSHPGFTAIDTPEGRYRVHAVNHSKLNR